MALFTSYSDTLFETVSIERCFYKNIVDIFLETIKLNNISEEEIKRRVEIVGIELINRALERGQSVVLMLGHFGNWEWVTSSAPAMNHDAVIGQIYHPLGNKVMDRIMLKLRSRFGTENIPMSKSVRRLLGIHQNNGKFVCGFIADQRPLSGVRKHWTCFCGIETAYVTGAEVVGAKIGAEFIYAEMLRTERGHYQLSLSRITPIPDNNEYPYSRAFLTKLEESIMRSPSSWLWSHNRWKHTRISK